MSAETDARAAATALRAAAKIIDRMNRIGNTPGDQLTDRQREEYAKYASYQFPGGLDLLGEHFDTARWLRDLADKRAQITAGREYGVMVLHQYSHKWTMVATDPLTEHQAHELLEQANSPLASKSGVIKAKIISRTKAGSWEDEE